MNDTILFYKRGMVMYFGYFGAQRILKTIPWMLTLKVLVATVDALGHFETG